MTTITKLPLAFVLIAGIALVVFSGELLYILYYRRNPGEASGDPQNLEKILSKDSPVEFLLPSVRGSSPPLVPPAACNLEEVASQPEVVTSSAERELARWRSRVLYTIKEEEREDADSDVEKGLGFGPEKDEGAETPYYTPAASPERGEV
ncbi:uncharacterized protein A4U43_C09F1160 [Asparagus officinalis]|uniref:Uncharacterized protein n=1 Tax=Asparagus officinalis TaxID=4686 RepID=A0A5P1E4B0_ASPOF|nr:uncharacterized protein A4U43_C09F1160 [Asparagus officinalis]